MKKKTLLEIKKPIEEKIKIIRKVTAPVDNIQVVSQQKFNERKTIFRFFLMAVFGVTVVLTILAYFNPYFRIDLVITRLIQGFNPFWFDTLMNGVSFLGDNITRVFLVIVVTGLLLRKKRNRDALVIIISTLGAAVIETTLKMLIHRPRPSPQLVHQTRQFFSPDSFPSGHVLFYVGFFGFLFYLVYTLPPKKRSRSIVLFVLGTLLLLIGPSRIYLGVHWFSDVVGAYLIGFLWLMAVIYIYNKLHPKVKEK